MVDLCFRLVWQSPGVLVEDAVLEAGTTYGHVFGSSEINESLAVLVRLLVGA